jgi:hypothetical protein
VGFEKQPGFLLDETAAQLAGPSGTSPLPRRRVGQRLRLLRREFEALANRLGGCEIEDERENLHLSAAKRAQERIDLVDAADQLGPTEPSASSELVVVLPARCLGGVPHQCGLAAFAADCAEVVTLAANCLLRGLGNAVNDPGKKLQHIPTGFAAVGFPATRGPAPANDFT